MLDPLRYVNTRLLVDIFSVLSHSIMLPCLLITTASRPTWRNGHAAPVHASGDGRARYLTA